MSPAPIIVHLDIPTAVPPYSEFEVRGWVASTSPISRVSVERPGETIVMALTDRPDVRAALANYPYTTGFVGYANIHFVRNGTVLTFTVHSGNQRELVDVALRPGQIIPSAVIPESRPVSERQSRKKLARLAPFLACPSCQTPVVLHASECRNCGAVFQFSDSRLDFLTPEQRRSVPRPEATPASHGGYDEVAYAIISHYANGLILDCGAGCRSRDFENVVNLEIMEYDSTDVRAVNEALPFANHTFNAVFSFATLEHVKDPFVAAREIVRVLKPGGILYSVVPLLAPYHGYPDHYYNMTLSGHKNLYGPDLEPIYDGVPLYGRPVFALTWIVNSWARGLPNNVREEFLDLPIRALTQDPYTLLTQPYVRYLDQTTNFEIAANTAILARKK